LFFLFIFDDVGDDEKSFQKSWLSNASEIFYSAFVNLPRVDVSLERRDRANFIDFYRARKLFF
jgi:hypothetical protein